MLIGKIGRTGWGRKVVALSHVEIDEKMSCGLEFRKISGLQTILALHIQRVEHENNRAFGQDAEKHHWISYLLLCKKLFKTQQLKTANIYYHIVSVAQNFGVTQLGGSAPGSFMKLQSKDIGQGCSYLKGLIGAGGSASKVTHFQSCSQKASVHCWLLEGGLNSSPDSLSFECHHDKALASPSGSRAIQVRARRKPQRLL